MALSTCPRTGQRGGTNWIQDFWGFQSAVCGWKRPQGGKGHTEEAPVELRATIFAVVETRGTARGREGNLALPEMKKKMAAPRSGDICSPKQRDSAGGSHCPGRRAASKAGRGIESELGREGTTRMDHCRF